MGNNVDKFLLLMWKNWLLQYRKPIQTIIEIVSPVIFSILLVLIRSLVDPEHENPRLFPPFCPVPLPEICEIPQNFESFSRYNYVTNMSLIYSPNHPLLNKTMDFFNKMGSFKDVEGYENSAILQSRFSVNSEQIFAALQFDDNFQTFQDNIKLSLRFPAELRTSTASLDNSNNDWRTNLIYPVYQSAGPRSPNDSTGAVPNYMNEGFLTLQYFTTIFIILSRKGVPPEDWSEMLKTSANQNISWPFINMRRFPYAAWNDDPLMIPLKSFVGIIVMLSFVYTCINTVRAITTEKEKQLKEAMKIMGLPNWLHWTAWFIKTLSYLMISIVLMVILLKVKWYKNTNFTVFTHSDPLVMLLFLFLYICATITFCFAISVFFSKANTAATIAGLAWFLSYAPFLFLQQNYETLSIHTKLTSSLGSNTAMAFGFQLMIMFEGTGEGLQWNNIWKPNSPDDTLTLGLIMMMLIIDSLIYLLVALYIEALFPGEYGVSEPWYFPFTSKFWCGASPYVGVEDFSSTEANEGEYFEAEPRNLHVGIQIKNLRKMFGNKAAVRNLSLNMYEDQITVLLGHNGAGKTTTMSMLTGMFDATSGTALINGYDIRTNISGVRNSLGLCPQHNIIFDDLTVAEHLYFFSKLKGLKKKDINAEIDKYVELLELQPKRNKKSSTLSGGMKRKLCVGIALCGKSKVVMLDEPTAGMDPAARRALWDLMLKQKTGRTLLLTTHFMDEADLLGDRIAIMAGGELQCCGSSFFLKKKYGAGYHLVMDKSLNCDPNQVTNLLRQYIPDIKIHSNVGSELTYLLIDSQSYIFEQMLKNLEDHSEMLGINSYGISLTTLEEVFMKVGADHGQEEIYNSNEKTSNGKVQLDLTQTNIDIELAPQSISPLHFLANQFLAMSIKKILSTIRSWVLLLIQVMMPTIFLIIAIVMVRQQANFGDLPAMPLSLNKFDNPVVLFESNASSNYENVYKELVGNAFQNEINITEKMLELTASNPAKVKRDYVLGASLLPWKGNVNIFDSIFTAYFNNDPYHTPGITLGLALNSVYKTIFSDSSIEYINHPMPFSAKSKIKNITSGNNLGFQLAFNIAFSMAFTSSFYVLFIVRERMSKSKHLQFVSGVKAYVFWITMWLWDFMTYILTILVLLITLVCFQEDGFKTASEIGRMFLILFYFGWSMLPMMYIAGYLFEVPSTGYTRMTLVSIFTGVAAFLVVQVLSTPGLDLEYVGNTLNWIFLLVPHYSLATGIRDSFTLYYYNKMCNELFANCRMRFPNITREECYQQTNADSYCDGLDEHYYKWESPGIGRNLIYSFSVGTVLFLALLLAEYKVFSKLIYAIKKKYFPKDPQPVPDEDSDVHDEKLRIRNTSEKELFQSYTIILKDLTKYYKNFLAVNGLCLGVKKYECFGLLGINGAGKTTTFKMLTGDVKITQGEAWINGKSIKQQIKEVQKTIGYCPQFDALLDDMTARETLIMFSLLRGIRYECCNVIAEKLANDFDFSRHLDKKVKELSGGNKRKLSTSIALIGDPPVLYLDEPTTGMDPATKRFLWNSLCKVRDSGKTIVLTSHSMEECEALCTRLAIMVNGNFKCLGSTQHLKNKFAEGYSITIKIKKPEGSSGFSHSSTEQIEKYISDHFPGAILREKHEELLTYYITDKSVPWSKMFGILERGKRGSLDIEDYSLGQSSLEQVFLTFTRHQH